MEPMTSDDDLLEGRDLKGIRCAVSGPVGSLNMEPMTSDDDLLEGRDLKGTVGSLNMNVHLTCQNGLGDKLLDVIGFYVLCKCLNYKANVNLNYQSAQYDWGNNEYDPRLFIFDDIRFTGQSCDYFVHSQYPSASLCPYKVYKYLHNYTFEQVSDLFVKYSKQIIQPSEIITSKYPPGIENAHGIHLRKSDKMNNNGDSRFVNSINEFDIITNRLLENVEEIISNEDDPKFIVVSEDNAWKIEIINRIKAISMKLSKSVEILDIDYTNDNGYQNLNSVLDMFCLSKCKTILQGVKYSTFSILAALLGNNKLQNYSHHLPNDNMCFIHLWNSVLEINHKYNSDIEYITPVASTVDNIYTDIPNLYT